MRIYNGTTTLQKVCEFPIKLNIYSLEIPLLYIYLREIIYMYIYNIYQYINYIYNVHIYNTYILVYKCTCKLHIQEKLHIYICI